MLAATSLSEAAVVAALTESESPGADERGRAATLVRVRFRWIVRLWFQV